MEKKIAWVNKDKTLRLIIEDCYSWFERYSPDYDEWCACYQAASSDTLLYELATELLEKQERAEPENSY